MSSRFAAYASLAGIVASFGIAGPAAAGSTPTLGGPAYGVGYNQITLSGTARPGATVRLYETAKYWNDWYASDDWENGGGPVTAVADGDGDYQLRRWLDSGMYYQVEADGIRSQPIEVDIQELPELTVTTAGTGAVAAHVVASPAEPWLPVEVQQRAGDGSWSTVASGYVSEAGTFDQTITNVAAGTQTYRSVIGGDPLNGVIAGYSASHSVTIAGPSVQFTSLQYRWGAINTEWFRLTNSAKQAADLTGWTVRDAQNNVYTFGSGYRLGAGQSVYVRTGKGTNTATNRFWGRTAYVWDDNGDTATLRGRDGKVVDTCRYGAGGTATAC